MGHEKTPCSLSARTAPAARTPPERFVALDGCCNFRGPGGYPAAGGRMVRLRLVYRSDALHRLTARGTEAFRALTIATVIDLRTPAELARHA